MPFLAYENDGFDDFKTKFDRVLDEMIKRYNLKHRIFSKTNYNGRNRLRKDRLNFLKNALNNQAKQKPHSLKNGDFDQNSTKPNKNPYGIAVGVYKSPTYIPAEISPKKSPKNSPLQSSSKIQIRKPSLTCEKHNFSPQIFKKVVESDTEHTIPNILDKSRTTVGCSTSACSSDTNSDATTAIMREKQQRKRKNKIANDAAMPGVKESAKVRQSRATLAPDSETTNQLQIKHSESQKSQSEPRNIGINSDLFSMANYVTTLHMDPNRQKQLTSENKYEQALNEATDLTHDLRNTITGLIVDLESKKQERKARKYQEKKRREIEKERVYKEEILERERLRQETRAKQFNGQIQQLKNNILELRTTVDDLQKRREKEARRSKRKELKAVKAVKAAKMAKDNEQTVIVIPVYYSEPDLGKSKKKRKKRKNIEKCGLKHDLKNDFGLPGDYSKRVDSWCRAISTEIDSTLLKIDR